MSTVVERVISGWLCARRSRRLRNSANRGVRMTERPKILFFAANPAATATVKLDEEARLIEQKLHGATYGQLIDFVTKWANRPLDLLDHLNRYEPEIVHYSGHGSATEEIILVDDAGNAKPVTKKALVELFAAVRKKPKVVVLNACYTKSQALAITDEVGCTIGMKKAIGDRAAIIFAAAFYSALGFGKSVGEAFSQGRVALLLEGIPEEDTPVLKTRGDVDADLLILASPL